MAPIGSTIRELWGWEGLLGNKYLGVGATGSLSVLQSGANIDITPNTYTTNNSVTYTTTTGGVGSNYRVLVEDVGSSANTYTTVYFNTPVAVGNLLLNGAYPITANGGSSFYYITSSVPVSVVASSSGILPNFTISSGSAQVTVNLPNHGYTVGTGLYVQFLAPTQVGSTLSNVTISGPYAIQSVIDTTSFNIVYPTLASTTASNVQMNGGKSQLVYYVGGGPAATTGYGLGYYGGSSNASVTPPSSLLTGYGTGSPAPSGGGTNITATDWSLANWGEVLLACPSGGPIYQWSEQGGYQYAQVIPTAPFFNGGIFVSQPQQILVAWGSVQGSGVRDPLIVRWSNALDYTNWTVSSQTWAGSFHIPTGSLIVGGIQSAQQGIIWTDIDCYVMQNIGQPLVFGFSRVGSGCGLVGMHAMGVLNGDVYWMSPNNIFKLGSNGVAPVPCPIWNFIFQNIDTANLSKVRCAVNSTFNEVTWFFPQAGGTGENTLYAKFNVVENEWDYGSLGRSAWIDVTVLGNPVGADLSGTIWQHETGYNAGTVAINSSFQTGYWSISDGNEICTVDWILPDMQFSNYNATSTPATLTLTFYAVDYPGDTPRTYGPYTFVQGTEFINCRIRGRMLAMSVSGADLNSFWRIGRIRYRYAPDGRR